MQGVEHYENFPVASWLCPPRLRAPIAAIYHYARTADDIADEGDAPAAQRLSELASYRDALTRCLDNPEAPLGDRWTAVFGPLGTQARAHQLPRQPLVDLLDAFEQDVRYTAEGRRYADMNELLDYCSRSANPVGRLLLHLYGVRDATSLRESDAICSALQLINFWQDLGQDLARQRHYLPRDVLAKHGVADHDLRPDSNSPSAVNMMKSLTDHARTLMLSGAPLAWRLPGRVGWELRLVVLGGLRILDKIDGLGWRTWQNRPRLQPTDLPVMLWRALATRPALTPSDAPSLP
jgi:squalene synthase HpnC